MMILALAACSADKPAGADTADASGPCAGGSWGWIEAPEDAVHVSPDGTGDGSSGAPMASLDAALDLARAEARPIALWPGEYATNLSLQASPAAGGTDAGLTVAGCGADELVLTPSDATLPIVLVTEATGVRLAGATLRGGRRALVAWSGAGLDVEAVSVEEPEVLGIAIDGSDTIVTLTDTEVRDVVAEDGVGYGVQVTGGELAMQGGGVTGATTAGILVDFATFSLDDVSVEDTSSNPDGAYGRGVQVQSQSYGSITASSFARNADAAVFSSTTWNLLVEGVTVTDTAAALDPDSFATTGDGLVVTGGDDGLDPATLLVTLTDNVVTGSARAGIVVAGVAAAIDGNDTAGNGASAGDGTSIWSQQGALASGTDAITTLSDVEALDVNTELPSPADLSD